MTEENKNRKKGLLVTILVHLGLIIAFSFLGLTYMIPPPEEEGITINFGTTDAGMNNIQNETPSETNENSPTETEVSETIPEEMVEDDIITQNIEDAPSIDKKDEVEKTVEKPKEKEKEQPQTDKNLSDAINKWKTKNTDQGGGDGNTDQIGDQGDINGDKNSKNYDGGGSGDGISFNLNGRNMVKRPVINDNSQETGKVIVDIIVDRYGKVLRATPGARGSTTTDAVLYRKAKKAAMETKFDANPDAPEEQRGQMTFIFILN